MPYLQSFLHATYHLFTHLPFPLQPHPAWRLSASIPRIFNPLPAPLVYPSPTPTNHLPDTHIHINPHTHSRAFQHYVAQDAYFLKYFARAYGIASSKALALDDETYSTLSRLLHGVHEELQLHGAYAARWGVDLAHLLSSPTDVGSTQFSASVAHTASNSSGSAPEADCSECFQGPSAATKAYTDFLMQVAEVRAGGQGTPRRGIREWM